MRNDGRSPGTYREYFQLVADGVTWMEDYGIYWEVTVLSGSAPASPTPTPTPSPSPLAPAAIYGDSRTGHVAHQAVVDQIVAQSPHVVFHVGDLVNDGTSSSDWDTFDSITGTMRADALFYPALGNHENNAALYFSHFELPGNERYYSVDYDQAHYIILDSNYAIGVGSDQYNWLTGDLSDNSSAKFTAVLFHHPMYSSGTLDPKGWIPILEQLFEDNGVDIVFQGHYHNYERCLHDGIYYIVTGGGGAPLADQGTAHECSQKFVKDYEFVRAQRSGDTMNYTVIDSTGDEIDSFSISR
jgi:predicted phosphodiesterase